MNGFIYYRGPSQINGDPIIGICTLESDNPKTGNMAQAWILHDTIHPVEAVQSGKDKAICGDCTAKDVCYVTVGFAPAQVWKKRNDYADLRRAPRKMRAAVAGKKIRLGAYGDPAAIPFENTSRLLAGADDWTGYSHQWRARYAQPYRELCMASVETIEDADVAQLMGWRTFRIKGKRDPVAVGEMLCPSETHNRQCTNCLACDGALKPTAASVTISVHGIKSRRWN